MIKVNDLKIFAEVKDIINELIRQGLLDPKTNEKSDYTMVCCPYHGEQHASSSITTTEITKGDKTVPVGFFNCFGCKAKGNLFEFVSQCLGKQDMGFSGVVWIKKYFKTEIEEDYRVDIKSNLRTRRRRGGESPYKVPEEVLASWRLIHPYMYERHLTDDVIEYFDIGYDEETKTVTFPVKDLRGDVCYVARRSVSGRYHVQEEGNLKTDYVWGLYECLQELNEDPFQKVFICESVFNACMYWKAGYLAVALLGTGGGKQYNLLLKLPQQATIIASLDPDKAGNIGTSKIKTEFSKYKRPIFEIIYPDYMKDEGKDINDISEEELLNLTFKWYGNIERVGD